MAHGRSNVALCPCLLNLILFILGVTISCLNKIEPIDEI